MRNSDEAPDGWQQLRQRFGDDFRASLQRNRPTFEFVRMVLTTALVVGLASYVTESSGGSLLDRVAVVALWSFAILLSVMTADTAIRFCALFGVVLAARLKLPYWRRIIHLMLAIVVFSMLLAILAIGSQEAQKAADRSTHVIKNR